MRRYVSLACRSYRAIYPAHSSLGWPAVSPQLLYRSCGSRHTQIINGSLCHAARLGSENTSKDVMDAFKKTLNCDIDGATTEYKDLLAFSKNSRPVSLVGYLGKWNNLSKTLSFSAITNPSQDQSIQIVSSVEVDQPGSDETHKMHKSLLQHSAILVKGYLRRKRMRDEEGEEEEAVEEGLHELEISVAGPDSGIKLLNEFPQDIILKPETQFQTRRRDLQIRNSPDIREILQTRAQIQQACRWNLKKFLAPDIVEIETPLLFTSTSEGAREFLVPTRRKGLAYALPQSPQQFKQILMSSGIPGYFQFAKCFRDEDLREDRQPEFTQLDLELAFASGRKVMTLVERLVKEIWGAFAGPCAQDQFTRKTYHEVMAQYGSDKPDLRIPIRPFVKIGHAIPVDLVRMLTSIDRPVIEVMVLPLTCTPNETAELVAAFFGSSEGQAFQKNKDGSPGVFVYDSTKPLRGLSAFGFEAAESIEQEFDLEDGALIILQARQDSPFTGGSTTLGRLRSALYTACVAAGRLEQPRWKDFKPLWVVDFPLFSPSTLEEPGQGGVAGLCSTHHPFTSPKTARDVNLLKLDPTEAIGDHFDLVINGEEIGGGSRRIHHAAMQELIFRDVLKMPKFRIEAFDHLLKALRSGCPPHAGFAIGFDRFVAMVMSCALEKPVGIRDVIAFPKIGKGSDPMFKCPKPMADEVLKTYHLSIRKGAEGSST